MKINNKTNKKKTINKVLWSCKKELILKIITSIIIRATLLIYPLFWSKAVDAITIGDYNYAVIMILLTLATNIVYYISECINQTTFYMFYNAVYSKLTKLATNSTMKNSMYSLSRFSLGEYTNILNNDINIIASFYSNTIIRVVRVVEFIIIYLYFLSLDIYIFLIAVIVSIIMLVVLVLTSKKTSEYNIVRKKELDKKTSIIHEVFNGIKEIKGLNVWKLIDQKVESATQADLNANAKYTKYYKCVKYIVLMLLEVSMYALILYGVYLVSKGEMLLGTVLVIYTYYTKIVSGFDIVSTVISEYKDLQVSKHRFNKLLEFCNYENIDYLEEKEYIGDIEFNSVIYGNKNDPILNNVTLNIKHNSITVITGKPGTGKTGIFDLLLRMNRQHTGYITIDGDNINEIRGDIYYQLVSSVNKKPHFFDLTIKENLMLINDDFEKIKEVCKELQIEDKILALTNGYDTNINQKGNNIPANLRYMLSIARVLIKDSKIMLFDETISMLEKKEQNIVLDIIKHKKKNHTIVLISRENNVIKLADKVIIMDNNMVIE